MRVGLQHIQRLTIGRNITVWQSKVKKSPWNI